MVFLKFMLVPKLPLGNVVFEAPASRRTAKQELEKKGFPSRSFGPSQSLSIDSDRGKIHLKTVMLPLNEGRGF